MRPQAAVDGRWPQLLPLVVTVAGPASTRVRRGLPSATREGRGARRTATRGGTRRRARRGRAPQSARRRTDRSSARRSGARKTARRREPGAGAEKRRPQAHTAHTGKATRLAGWRLCAMCLAGCGGGRFEGGGDGGEQAEGGGCPKSMILVAPKVVVAEGEEGQRTQSAKSYPTRHDDACLFLISFSPCAS